MSDGGKGSVPRPIAIAAKDFAARWDNTFKKQKKVLLTNEFSPLRQNDNNLQSIDFFTEVKKEQDDRP